MAQHDYVIDNQASASARADLNSLFQAIASQNSGATAPTTTYANQIWYDTATDLLKMRNEANSGWITLGTVDQTNNVFNPNFLPATQAEAQAGSNNVKGMTPLRVSQAIAALVPAGTTVNYQLFTATGTWTKPSGLSANAVVHFHVIGAGSSGCAYFRGSGTLRYVNGGQGGGGFIASVLASSLGATVSVTVGAGGAARTASGSSTSTTGAIGGASSFGSYGPSAATSGPGSTSNANSPLYYYHGFDGCVGGDSSSDSAVQENVGSVYGGGAGGSNASASVLDPGTSKFGGSGGAGATGTSAVATAGSAPGGGGGAASSTSTSTSGTVTSGAGARGEVRVWTIG